MWLGAAGRDSADPGPVFQAFHSALHPQSLDSARHWEGAQEVSADCRGQAFGDLHE